MQRVAAKMAKSRRFGNPLYERPMSRGFRSPVTRQKGDGLGRADLRRSRFYAKNRKETSYDPSKNFATCAGIALLSVPAFHAAASNEVLPFEDATMSVVYSASDDDAQILIRATGSNRLARCTSSAPAGRFGSRRSSETGAAWEKRMCNSIEPPMLQRHTER